MKLSEIVKRMETWRDFYGGDIPDTTGIKTKEQARAVLEEHRTLMEDTLRDAESHLDDFERELGLY